MALSRLLSLTCHSPPLPDRTADNVPITRASFFVPGKQRIHSGRGESYFIPGQNGVR